MAADSGAGEDEEHIRSRHSWLICIIFDRAILQDSLYIQKVWDIVYSSFTLHHHNTERAERQSPDYRDRDGPTWYLGWSSTLRQAEPEKHLDDIQDNTGRGETCLGSLLLSLESASTDSNRLNTSWGIDLGGVFKGRILEVMDRGRNFESIVNLQYIDRCLGTCILLFLIGLSLVSW
jgi:hypothetical protein